MKIKFFISTIIIVSMFCAGVNNAGIANAETNTLVQTNVTNSITFNDVNADDWYYNTVMEMARKGILSGYSDGSFKPNASITSAEFTSVIGRIMVAADAQHGNF